MIADIWVKDGMDDEYIGPTSQVETPVHYEEKRNGLETGCRSCQRAVVVKLSAKAGRAINVTYVADGTRHNHSYIQTFDGEDD